MAALIAGAISLQLFGQSPKTGSQYTGDELKRMIRGAQTPSDFEDLTDRFAQEASRYQSKSEAEEKELKRLLALPYHARSYAAQLESTRNRIDHYQEPLPKMPRTSRDVPKSREGYPDV